MGSNDVNNTPKEISSPQCVQHIDGQYRWYSEEVEARHLEQLWITQVGCITFLIGKSKFQLWSWAFVSHTDTTMCGSLSF
jgi:hypothetical protein